MTIKTVQLLFKQAIKLRPLVSFFEEAKYVYVNYVCWLNVHRYSIVARQQNSIYENIREQRSLQEDTIVIF